MNDQSDEDVRRKERRELAEKWWREIQTWPSSKLMDCYAQPETVDAAIEMERISAMQSHRQRRTMTRLLYLWSKVRRRIANLSVEIERLRGVESDAEAAAQESERWSPMVTDLHGTVSNLVNELHAKTAEIERLREKLRKAVELLNEAAPRFVSYEECMDWQDQGEDCIAKDGHWEHELRTKMDEFVERNKETK